ncbi:MAG: hypothetical protein Sapg2KO_21310 [Saprospiraceae bacterium]
MFFIAVLLFFTAACQEEERSIKEAELTKFTWKTAQKINATFITAIDTLSSHIKNGDYGYIDELFIAKQDSVLYHEKFKLDYTLISKDKKGKMGCGSNMCTDSSDIHLYNYYHPKYHPFYLDSEMHTLQSVTKSVASTIVGAAIENGQLTRVETPLFPFFEEGQLSETIANHFKKATIEDVLTMQLGLKWAEFGMSLEMETDVSAMELSEDWVAYTLNRSIIAPPGDQWNYNSGASQLLSHIIKQVANENIEEYGGRVLFQKLGISDYYWKKTPTGLSDTEGGLYLKAGDLAKIGLLYLQDGIWNEERILPDDWVENALGKQVTDIYQDGGKEGYGYQWWITGDEPPLAVGLGYGNQILVIVPEENIVGVVYAWNVFDNEAKYIFRDFVDVLMSLKD